MKNKFNHFIFSISIFSFLVLLQVNSFALVFPFNLPLSGTFENPPNASPGSGTIIGTYDNVTKEISFTITYSGLAGLLTASHFHAAAGPTTNSPVRINFASSPLPLGTSSGSFSRSYILTAQQEAWLLSDSMYANVHSNVFPGGELRHQMSLDAPLPVELSSFVSAVNGNEVTLNWTTLSELNNAGFEIERKALNNNEWAIAGFVKGHGTIKSSANYNFSEVVNTGIYNYRLKQIDVNGNYEYFNLSNEVSVGIPDNYSLSQNYPNPFNPTTKINYELQIANYVSLKIFDALGNEVAALVNEKQNAGSYSINFDGANIPSGIYFYKLESGNFSDTKRMILLK